ncbi:hypothetical protein RSAG8_11926, partial [Rhizoctonia solani AG-8 WAC10335]
MPADEPLVTSIMGEAGQSVLIKSVVHGGSMVFVQA